MTRRPPLHDGRGRVGLVHLAGPTQYKCAGAIWSAPSPVVSQDNMSLPGRPVMGWAAFWRARKSKDPTQKRKQNVDDDQDGNEPDYGSAPYLIGCRCGDP